jgi:hypothetical protein
VGGIQQDDDRSKLIIATNSPTLSKGTAQSSTNRSTAHLRMARVDQADYGQGFDWVYLVFAS